jgi:hypothetical protein
MGEGDVSAKWQHCIAQIWQACHCQIDTRGQNLLTDGMTEKKERNSPKEIKNNKLGNVCILEHV